MNITVATIDPVTLTARTQKLTLNSGATALDAAQAAGYPHADSFAVYNQRVEPEHTLNDGDRLDIGTSLLIDPKEARRLRAENTRPMRIRALARHGGKHQLIN